MPTTALKSVSFNGTGMRPYVFVFWSDMFDEVMATVLTTEIRKVGLRVELIGFSPSCATGIHGISIKCDKTIGQIIKLANRAICIIFPCKVSQMIQLEDDPRIEEFLHQADQAQIVTGHLSADDLDDLKLLKPHLSQIDSCPDSEEMFGFAHELARKLSVLVGV